MITHNSLENTNWSHLSRYWISMRFWACTDEFWDKCISLAPINYLTLTVDEVHKNDWWCGSLESICWKTVRDYATNLHVVFPTPPLPPTKTHFNDFWSRIFWREGVKSPKPKSTSSFEAILSVIFLPPPAPSRRTLSSSDQHEPAKFKSYEISVDRSFGIKPHSETKIKIFHWKFHITSSA